MEKSYAEENETMMIFFKRNSLLSFISNSKVGRSWKIAFDYIVFVSQSFPFFFFFREEAIYTSFKRAQMH